MISKGWKAFHKGLICKDKQYAENTTFEETGGKICGPGMMHFCENPFDCLDYYPLVNEDGEFSDFAEVEALDEPVTDDGKKYATKKLRIGAQRNFEDFIKAGVGFLIKKTIKEMPRSEFEDITGAQIGSSGDCAKIGSSGDGAQIGSSGNYAQIGSSGDGAQIGSSGNCAKIDVKGPYGVAAAVGINSCIRAKKGNWITLAEWGVQNGRDIPLCVKSVYVDGDSIKENIWYMLKNGEFTEVEEDE